MDETVDLSTASLQDAEYAHMAARCAWLHPNDEQQRENAEIACAMVGVGYVEMVARYLEAFPEVSPDLARRKIAEALRAAADKVYEAHARH